MRLEKQRMSEWNNITYLCGRLFAVVVVILGLSSRNDGSEFFYHTNKQINFSLNKRFSLVGNLLVEYNQRSAPNLDKKMH